MVRGTGERFRSLLDLVGEVHATRSLDEFREALIPALRRVAPADFVSYNEVLGGDRPLATIVDPEMSPAEVRTWSRYARENPLLVQHLRTRDGRAYRFSDVITRSELHKLGLYRQFYRPLGIEHQIAFTLPAPPELVIAVALSRGRPDFSSEEQAMLNLARPHLIQAYRNAQLHEHTAELLEAMRQGTAATGTALIVVSADGAVEFASPAARSSAAALGVSTTEGQPLPISLSGPRDGTARTVRGRDGERVLIRTLPTAGGMRLVVLVRATVVLSAARLAHLGLTTRQADVLAQLARGKATAEIAAALGISSRTVHKHLQAIHSRLGVTDRTQAVATAWAAVSAAGAGER